MTVRRSSGLPSRVVYVNPVTPRHMDFVGRQVAALLWLVEPGSRPWIDPRPLAEALRLAPAETAVAVFLTQGSRVSEIAVEMGCKEASVYWHLRRIYKKRGIWRQSDWVRQLLSESTVPGSSRRRYPSPFLNSPPTNLRVSCKFHSRQNREPSIDRHAGSRLFGDGTTWLRGRLPAIAALKPPSARLVCEGPCGDYRSHGHLSGQEGRVPGKACSSGLRVRRRYSRARRVMATRPCGLLGTGGDRPWRRRGHSTWG